MKLQANHLRNVKCDKGTELTFRPDEASKLCKCCRTEQQPGKYTLLILTGGYVDGVYLPQRREAGQFATMDEATEAGRKAEVDSNGDCDFVVTYDGNEVPLGHYHRRRQSCELCSELLEFGANDEPRQCHLCCEPVAPAPYQVMLKMETFTFDEDGLSWGETHRTLQEALDAAPLEKEDTERCWGWYVAYLGTRVW